jgi:predicted permease
MAESLLLSLAGGAAGLGVAHFGVKLIMAFLAGQIPRATEVRLDATVLGFTLAASLITGVLAGLWPSWRSSRVDVNDALKLGSGRGDSESSRRFTRSILVTAEVALSLMLLIGAGLTIRSLWILNGISPGLDPHNVLTMSVAIPSATYAGRPRQIQFFSEALHNIRAIPGVESAGTTDTLPLTGGGSMQPVVIEGRPAAVFAEQPEVAVRRIGTQYLHSLHIPLLRGRDFTEGDTQKTTPVVLISESMATQFWPGQDPTGHQIVLSFVPDTTLEVVGVVGDVKDNGLDVLQPVPTLYAPHAQFGGGGMSLVVRTKLPPASMTQAVVDAVRRVDHELPLTEIKTMDDVIAESLSQRRFTMMVLAAFAGLALILSAVGIYSVLSYTVRKRLREISIRMAVGAQVGDVLRLVVMEAMKPAVLGIVLGLAGAQALTRMLAAQVYGVAVTDPATYAVTSLGLIAVALAASIIPAWRAARVDPLKSLRDD